MKIHMPDPYFLEQRGFHFAACGCIGNPQAFTTDTQAVTCKHCLRRIEACRKIREETIEEGPSILRSNFKHWKAKEMMKGEVRV